MPRSSSPSATTACCVVRPQAGRRRRGCGRGWAGRSATPRDRDGGDVLTDVIPTDVRAWWRIALAVELVGSMRAALDLTVAHVSDRIQFGRPIGSFQAVQHGLAKCAVAIEGARWLAYEAAWSGDPTRGGDGARRLRCGRRARAARHPPVHGGARVHDRVRPASVDDAPAGAGDRGRHDRLGGGRRRHRSLAEQLRTRPRAARTQGSMSRRRVAFPHLDRVLRQRPGRAGQLDRRRRAGSGARCDWST